MRIWNCYMLALLVMLRDWLCDTARLTSTQSVWCHNHDFRRSSRSKFRQMKVPHPPNPQGTQHSSAINETHKKVANLRKTALKHAMRPTHQFVSVHIGSVSITPLKLMVTLELFLRSWQDTNWHFFSTAKQTDHLISSAGNREVRRSQFSLNRWPFVLLGFPRRFLETWIEPVQFAYKW